MSVAKPAALACWRAKLWISRMPLTDSASVAVTRAKLSCWSRYAWLRRPRSAMNQRPHAGHHDQDDQEQPPVVIGHQRRRDQRVAALHHRHEGDVLHADAHDVDVGGDARDQAAEGRAREEAHRQAQQVGVDLVAQVVDDGLAQAQRQPRAIDEADLGERRQRQEADRAGDGAGHVAVGDGAADHARHRPRHQRQLDGARDDQHGQRVAQARVRPRVAEQAGG